MIVNVKWGHPLLIVWCFLLFSTHAFAQLIAFPGAEGAGKFTTGGRGTPSVPTTVFEVTTLKDTNAVGSLRYACSKTATYRTIVFRVSGTIHLNAKLNIPKNTTIAGQTAPGGGICLADYPVTISGDNVIFRYIRCRLGDKSQLITSPAGCGVPVAPFTSACMPLDGSGSQDALGNTGNKNIIIDHCTASWSDDEALSIYRGDSITLQWNMMTEPLNYSYHFETGDVDFERHAYGGIWGSLHGSFHHNLFAHCKSRNPRFAGNSTYPVGDTETCDFRNNVIYNWELFTVYGGEGGHYNLVNNYYKWGPSTGSATISRVVNVDSSATAGYAKYYLSGNYMDGSTPNTNNNWLGAAMASGKAADTVKSKTSTPFLSNLLPTNTPSASIAFDSVLNFAGAILPTRDTLDKRIVNDVRYRKGRLIDAQGGYPHAVPYDSTLNAWPYLFNLAAPTDTDHDGMPDAWESANGSNPNNAADRANIASNGYTLLENYLNGITFSTPDITFSGVLDSFYQPFSIPSLEQTMLIASNNLAGAVTITPPLGFEISVNDTIWYNATSPLILAPNAGVLNYSKLFIRLNAVNNGAYVGNIVCSTAGVADFYLKVKGIKSGLNAPVISANATWTLLTDQTGNSNGDITATNQTLGSSIVGLSYGNSFGGTTGWQRVGNTSFLPTAYQANCYTEYSITPANNKYLTVYSLSFSALGGSSSGVKVAIYYSYDGFATSFPLGTCKYAGKSFNGTIASPLSLLNTGSGMLSGDEVAAVRTSIGVAPTQTLSIRIYTWLSGTGNRYFAAKNVSINAVSSVGPLPLTITNFKATYNTQKHALLTWTIANEKAVHHFVVERSIDGKSFTAIGTLSATNNDALNTYHFTDVDANAAIQYYRIKLVHQDFTSIYSNTLSISKKEQPSSLSLFPNPATDLLNVSIAPTNTKSTIQITSIEGKLLATYVLPPNTTNKTIDIRSFAKGCYLIALSNDLQHELSKFIKQ